MLRSAALLLAACALWAQEEGRITTGGEVDRAVRPAALWPLRILAWPYARLTGGMEKGLIVFENHRLRERFQKWTEDLRLRGVEYRFGGSGEGAGLGGGGLYTLRMGERSTLQSMGLLTFKNYQEFLLRWKLGLPAGTLFTEASYQWRPQENYYGAGNESVKGKHSNFALRQTWMGIRWEIPAGRHWRWGALYKIAWLKALPGRSAYYSSPDVFFGNLPGYGMLTRLHTAGTYLDFDLIRGEYQWGGAAHWGASHNDGLGSSRLAYCGYEMQLEGRMPIVGDSSALVGQANFELNRERGGSGPIPFYLLPHVGGSSTLRGFALDRFYGRNLALLSLEYRYRVHPNIQAVPFFDEGQIFNRTGDLSWLNWHRNYGFGFRFRQAAGTFLRVEYGRSNEGFQLHITFGDRERPPLRGPIRYGAYKR